MYLGLLRFIDFYLVGFLLVPTIVPQMILLVGFTGAFLSYF